MPKRKAEPHPGTVKIGPNNYMTILPTHELEWLCDWADEAISRTHNQYATRKIRKLRNLYLGKDKDRPGGH